MGVHIDKAGGHDFALRVDLFAAFGGHVSDAGDPASIDGDVGFPAGRSRSVDDETIANDEIMGHGRSSVRPALMAGLSG